MTRLIALLLAFFAFATTAEARPHPPRPVVIGYLATFKDMKPTVDAVDFSRLTHVNIAFLNPDLDGVFEENDHLMCMKDRLKVPMVGEELRYAIARAHKAHVKVLVSLGGGTIPLCSGDYGTLLAPDKRAAVIANLMKFVKDYDLDGVDIDIEWDVLTKLDNAGLYTPFIADLRHALKARHKLLTCATASHPGGMVPVESVPYFDYINVMSYDFVGPNWGTPGEEHATYAQAEADLKVWQNRGATKQQLLLGLPFYGYGFNGYNRGYDYKNILTTFGPEAADADSQGKLCAGCQYITYNGRPTIRRKTELALSQGAGVMIWELSADTTGDDSLLSVVTSVLDTAK